MTKEQLEGITRHVLTFVGGILVVKGYTDEQTAAELMGTCATLAGLIWSILSKRK